MSERLEIIGFQAFLDFEIRCADCTKMRGKFGKDDERTYSCLSQVGVI